MRYIRILALVLPLPLVLPAISLSNFDLSGAATLTQGQQTTITGKWNTSISSPKLTSFNIKVAFDPIEFAISNINAGSDWTGTFASSTNTSDFTATGSTGNLTTAPNTAYTLLTFVITARNNAPVGSSDLIVTTGTTINGSGGLNPTPGPTYNALKDVRVTVEASEAPEPGTMGLLLTGIPLTGLGMLRRRRR